LSHFRPTWFTPSVDSATALPPVTVHTDGSASLSALPPSLPSIADEALRRADEVVHRLTQAREYATVLENAQVELVFTGPRDARGSGSTRKRALRRVLVKLAPRIRTTRKNGRSCLELELCPAGGAGGQKLRLRVDVLPVRGKQDPALISVGIAAFRMGQGSEDAESEELLTRTPVLVRFDLDVTNASDNDNADDVEPVGLPSVQNLGPMLGELQHAWFPERMRAAKPRNLEFASASDLSAYWVSATNDESWVSWQPATNESAETTNEEAGRFLAALVIWRCVAALYAGNDEGRRPLRQLAGLPEPEEFFPKRPVDLNPSEVREHLAQRKLRVPWHVIEAARTSLNAGKHVIFTGPPGCGKTELAVEFALFATQRERDGLLVTASPAWSASELVGRYIPRQASYGLILHPASSCTRFAIAPGDGCSSGRLHSDPLVTTPSANRPPRRAVRARSTTFLSKRSLTSQPTSWRAASAW
jgi:hypothetical protein